MVGENGKTSEERKELLTRLIESRVSLGRHVESRSDFQAMLSFGWPRNRFLRRILGLTINVVWFPIGAILWLLLFIITNLLPLISAFLDQGYPIFNTPDYLYLSLTRREIAKVDEYGNTSVVTVKRKFLQWT